MAKKLPIFVSLLIIMAVLAGSAAASGSLPRHDFTEAPDASGYDTGYVLVTFKDLPAASFTGGIGGLQRTKPDHGKKFEVNRQAVKDYVNYLSKAHQNYRAYLNNRASKATIVAEYFYTLNGFAVQLNGANRSTLKAGPGVKEVIDDWLYQPSMNVSVGLIGATDLWPLAGGRENAGEGIKVGIIDSGIDPTQQFFACKDSIPAKVYASGDVGDPNNILVFDHGTHVAGTAAGCLITLTEGPITGEISGIAPAAQLYDYNVFPGFGVGYVFLDGEAFSHDIAKAVEDAVVDGMDVINMSLSGTVQGPHDMLAEAVNAAVDAGVVVAVAAGNSGPGDSTVESPGSAAGALTAGAVTNAHYIGISVTVSNVGTFGAATGDFLNFDPPILGASFTTTTPTDGCTAIAEDLSGLIAVIDRGACTFGTKIRNAEARGAIGVIMVNNVAGDPIAMGDDGLGFPNIPAAMVSQADGPAIKAAAGTETMDVDGTSPTEFITNNGDIIAGFSGRGPSPFNYLIKPDVTAPGVNVYSSVFDNQFAMFQGTSMATPHLSGSAALLLQLHPDWSPADVKSALVNNAARVVTDGTNDPGVLARGGGRIDLVAANDTPVTIAPASASFGFWGGNKNVSQTMDLSILNVSSASQTCSVLVSGDPLVTAPGSFSVDAGASTTLTLDLEAGKSNQTPSGDYDGDVEITCGSTLLRVPWWVRIDRQAKP
jgi:minor extracellular serine protease Vpr